MCIFHRSITREQQDTLAARSHARAAAAQKSGRFDSQIVPVRTQWRDPKTKEVTRILVEKDDGIREGTTLVSLFFLFIYLFSYFPILIFVWAIGLSNSCLTLTGFPRQAARRFQEGRIHHPWKRVASLRRRRVRGPRAAFVRQRQRSAHHGTVRILRRGRSRPQSHG